MRNKLFWILCGCLIAAALVFVGMHEKPLPPLQGTADHIVVHKHDHSMGLYRGGALVATYTVALGRGGLGPKLKAGDNRVPEGSYTIVSRNADSAFHKALRVSYPTPAQVAHDKSKGIAPGGDIMVHGIRNGLGWLGRLQRSVDWTKGCVAVTDAEIDQIWQAVPVGAQIDIEP